jgi:hypothetical protein
MTRLVLLLAVLAAGCQDDRERRRLREEFDFLARERQLLTTHQANLRRAADAELAGRPQGALPPDARLRLTGFQQEYAQADLRLRFVDAEIESVQSQLANID